MSRGRLLLRVVATPWLLPLLGAAPAAFLLLGQRSTQLSLLLAFRLRVLRTETSPGGGAAIRLYIYGDASGTASAMAETSELVRTCLEHAEGCGQCPALIAGDLNTTLDTLDCAPALAVGGWIDLCREATCAAPEGDFTEQRESQKRKYAAWYAMADEMDASYGTRFELNDDDDDDDDDDDE